MFITELISLTVLSEREVGREHSELKCEKLSHRLMATSKCVNCGHTKAALSCSVYKEVRTGIQAHKNTHKICAYAPYNTPKN